MYNKDLKKLFVDEHFHAESSRTVAWTILNAAGTFEDEWDADFCTVDKVRLQSMVDSIVGAKSNSKWMYLNTLKEYAKWAKAHNVEGACDAIFKIDVIGLQKVKEQTVSSPMHLQNILDSMYHPESQKTVDNTRRCFFWLAYSGLKEEDIPCVKKDNIDLSLMRVSFNGKDYPLYRESLPTIKSCMEDVSFQYINPNYTKPIWRDRVSGDTLLRGVKSNSSDIVLFRIAVSKEVNTAFTKNKIKVKISYNRVFNSGLFYRMFERERMGDEPNFMNAAWEFTEGKTYQLSSGRNTFEAKVRKVARCYLSDYERWKLAYFI